VKADNFYGLTYDRAAGKWLPVARNAVAPDGGHYAYWEWQTRSFQAIDVGTGSETVLGPKPNGAASAARINSNAGSWQLLDAADTGVYATFSTGYQGGGPGLWLFPWSGSGERQVIAADFWQAIGGGAAWGTVSQSVPEGAADTIIRLDLSGGGPSDWFSRPGLHSRVIGFDSDGHPVVEASSKDVTEVWLITGQSSSSKLLTVPPPTQQGQNGPGPGRAVLRSVVGDGNGIWLATTDGLYLAAGDRVEKVSTVTGELGGGCF
jgi:hypothetical protein